MLSHLGHFLGAVMAYFFDAIGTTVLGWIVDLAFAASVAIAVLSRKQKEGGWAAMRDHFKMEYRQGIKFAAWCALIIYGPIALWSVGKAVYADHQALVQRSKDQRGAIKNDAALLQTTTDTFQGKIVELRAQCANLQGKNETLSNQNRDQQNSVNNCQTQALKMMAKSQVHSVKTFMFSHSNLPGPKMEYVLTTATAITPVDAIVSCDIAISEAEISPMTEHGSSIFNTGEQGSISPKEYRVGISSPAWTSEFPMIVTVSFVPPVQRMPNCKITIK